MTRFAISYDRAFGWLAWLLRLRRDTSFVELDGGEVIVTMGWGFRARFPRAAVNGARRYDKKPLSRGVHGLGGRWLVNGSGLGIVRLDLAPVQRAYVLGVPVKLRELLVSVEDPDALVKALGAAG